MSDGRNHLVSANSNEGWESFFCLEYSYRKGKWLLITKQRIDVTLMILSYPFKLGWHKLVSRSPILRIKFGDSSLAERAFGVNAFYEIQVIL